MLPPVSPFSHSKASDVSCDKQLETDPPSTCFPFLPVFVHRELSRALQEKKARGLPAPRNVLDCITETAQSRVTLCPLANQSPQIAPNASRKTEPERAFPRNISTKCLLWPMFPSLYLQLNPLTARFSLLYPLAISLSFTSLACWPNSHCHRLCSLLKYKTFVFSTLT